MRTVDVLIVNAPVALATELRRLTPLDRGGFRATTSRGDLTARQVVVATGTYHTPRIPPAAARISDRVTQLHSHDHRNAAAPPDGAVLVVGSGQTGLQLAEELFEAGRPVYVSVGSAGRIPRRADGFFDERFPRPIHTDIERAELDLPRPTTLPSPTSPQSSPSWTWRAPASRRSFWATGHDLDYSWVAAPVLDELGYPRNVRGVSAVPGLCFLGLLWQHSQASASLLGPALDGPHLLDAMSRDGLRGVRAA